MAARALYKLDELAYTTRIHISDEPRCHTEAHNIFELLGHLGLGLLGLGLGALVAAVIRGQRSDDPRCLLASPIRAPHAHLGGASLTSRTPSSAGASPFLEGSGALPCSS